MQFRDLKSQYRALKPQMDEAIQAVLDSSDYIAGDQVEELEKELEEAVRKARVGGLTAKEIRESFEIIMEDEIC